VVYFNATVLAIIEGLTEFLPVSSTGHMILFENFFPIAGSGPSFRNAYIELVQLPAILAVVLYFWRKIWPFAQPRERRHATLWMWVYIGAAFLPAAVLGVLFKETIEQKLFHDVPIALALLIGGVLLIVVERRRHTERYATVGDIPFTIAVGIGFFQCLAFLPGTSRSAATIIGALLLGTSRAAAAEFSFFLAIPTMFAVAAATLHEYGLVFSTLEWSLLALGSAVSFATAYAAVAVLMHFIQGNVFTWFGVYRIVLGGIVLIVHFALRA